MNTATIIIAILSIANICCWPMILKFNKKLDTEIREFYAYNQNQYKSLI